MDDRPDKLKDDANLQAAGHPGEATATAETSATPPTPAEIAAYRQVIDDIRHRRPARGITSTDEFMRLIRDDI